eukprot:101852_1
MDHKAEELTELTSDVPSNDKHTDSKRLQQSSSNVAQYRVPVSLTSMRSQSSVLVIGLREKEQESCAKCLDSKCCGVIWKLLFALFIGITFMTPTASIIAGWKIGDIFDRYSSDQINEQCDGQYSNMVYNGADLGTHAHTAFIFGTIDLILLLCEGACLYGYIYRDMIDMDRNVFGIMAGVRIFFIIVWLVYASFMFKASDVIEQHCDPNGTFYNDMMNVFVWYLPILAIEVVKTFILIAAVVFGCCLLCCIA